MAYTKDGNSLLTQVIDIPVGGGKDEKTHKHLFQAPFLAEAENIEVDKTGSSQKRDGIQTVIPSALPSGGLQPMSGSGTLFEHSDGQIGVVGKADFTTAGTVTMSTLSTIENNADFATARWQPSNKTGLFACGIEEDPAARSDEAIIHMQSSVSGNLVITVWCSAVDPVSLTECYDASREMDNRCYYVVKERDTGTVVVPPSRLYDVAQSGFDQNPRYVHIALVDNNDPHWVVVAAPELYQQSANNYLTAASISVSTNLITYNKLSFIDGGQGISKFTAFDMHAGKDSETSALSSYAHIIAQAETGAGHSDYVFRIDKTLTVSLGKALATNEVPEHCGAIFHDVSLGKVFTAVSNQDAIAGALPGDGETWVHGYNDTTYGVIAGYPVKVFAQTIPAAWPSHEIGITGACTRLSICAGAGEGIPYRNTSLYVFGTQFWNPAGYIVKDTGLTWRSPASATGLDHSVNASKLVGSKSFLNTKWTEIEDAYTANPIVAAPVDHASCYITTKGFKGLASEYPMIGLSVTNGSPLTAYKLGNLAEVTEAKYKTRLPPNAPLGPVSPRYEPQAGNCPENQPGKHPMGVIVTPLRDEKFLRPIARFGADLVTEAEDVFPYEEGVVYNSSGDQSFTNVASRWASPGLSEVHTTEVAGEHLFVYRSRLQPGVSRLPELNRLKMTTLAVNAGTYSGVSYGVMYSTNAAGAFGGEEVRLNTDDTRLIALKDREQTYFSGGYLGFFDGVDNGESDVHSSPGQPFIQLYSYDGGGYVDFSRPDLVTIYSNSPQFRVHEKARYTFVLVYALYDENGRVHRSAPSPERVVYGSIDYATGTLNTIGAVAIRYLMPPLSAFWLADQESRAKKLVVEVYAKVDNSMTSIGGSADRDGALLNVSSFTLIDSFEPELTPTLQQKFSATLPTSAVTGVSTTPWSVRDKELGFVRSGFKFFGERVIYRPKFFLEDNKSEKENNVSAGEFSTTTLYTNGGVIQNDPPPAFSCIHTCNRRMWGIPSNDRSSVWYSKLLASGKAPEWTATFTMSMPRSDGDLTAISSMDEKAVLFSRTSTFIIVGEGPNNLGRGSGFNGPRKVAVGIGCVNRSSIVTGPFGVMFQAERGIHVLGRNMQVTYIGSKVEDQVISDTDISSAVLVEEKYQVRFTLNKTGQTQLKVLVYDYLHDVWTVFTSSSSDIKNTVSSTVHNAVHTFLGSANYVSRDVAGSFYDGNPAVQTPIVSKFTTAWIKLAGIQGFKRVKRSFFLGQHLGGKVSLSAQYNYNEGVSTTKSWTDAEIVALSTDPMQLGLHIPRQKCESIRFVYSDEDIGAVPAGGDIISSITIQFGAKTGMYKMSEGSKK